MSEKLYLVLENGKVFEGKPFGARGEITGEIVFTTVMTGYPETLTDQSFHGQIVVHTFPLIGNYGIIPSDFESGSVKASAYIVKHWCREPSNFRSEDDLDTFLRNNNVIGLYDIDTRALTKILREKGVMNGRITRDPSSVDLTEIRSYTVTEPVRSVPSNRVHIVKSEEGRYKVAFLDLGSKESIKRELVKRGCDLHILPTLCGIEDVLSICPDGIVLSNGPGDPMDNPEIIAMLSQLRKSGIPIFGIGLGHQLLALAAGFERSKLKHGHRGANQPAKELNTGRVFITGQNHSYAVIPESIDPNIAKESFKNVNDGTCEGIDYTDCPAFSVQFHPGSGPRDTVFLFDKFIEMLNSQNRHAVDAS